MTKRRSDVPVFLLFAGIIHAIGLALLLPMLITLPGPEGESAPAPEIPSVDVIVLPPPQPLTDVGPEETSALPSTSRGDEGNATGEAVPVAAEPEPGQEPRDDISVVAPKAERQAEPAPQETKPPEAGPPEAEPPEAEPSQAEPLAAATPERDGAEAMPKPKSAVANVTPAVEPQAVKLPQQTDPAGAPPSAIEVPMTDEPGKEASEAKQAVPGKSDAKGSAPKKFAPRTAKSQNKFAPFNTLSELLAPPAQKRR